MDEPTPDDTRTAVTAAVGALKSSADADWSVLAGDLEWSCRRTLDHIIDAVVWYAANLATASSEDCGDLRDGAPVATSIADLLRRLEPSGYILARVAEATPPGVRGYHGAGMADASGRSPDTSVNVSPASCETNTWPVPTWLVSSPSAPGGIQWDEYPPSVT